MFNTLTREVGDFNPFGARAWANLRACFLNSLGGQRAASLLDIGCGTGQSRQIYRDACDRFAGLDLAQSSLLRARALFPSDEWVLGDAMRLPFPDMQWDAVAFSSVLHHIPDRLAALREAYRVLRPGGMVFAYDPNLLHPAMAIFRHPGSPLYDPRGVSPFERPLLPSRLRREVHDAGFVGVTTRCQADLPYRKVDVPWINRCLAVYNAADYLLEKMRLGRVLGSFIITTARRPGPSRG